MRRRRKANSAGLAALKRRKAATLAPVHQFKGDSATPDGSSSERARQIVCGADSFVSAVPVLIRWHDSLLDGQHRLCALRKLGSTGSQISLRNRKTTCVRP